MTGASIETVTPPLRRDPAGVALTAARRAVPSATGGRQPTASSTDDRAPVHASAGAVAVGATHDPLADLPFPRPVDRRRAKWLYDRTWGRSRSGPGWELPPGTRTVEAPTPLDPLRLWHLPGDPGAGTVVLAHPDRRYGGHWFVKEGWIEALQQRGLGVAWFDQPGYGRGNGGSPFLYENIAAACIRAKRLDPGPVRLVGISLGAFGAALAAPHVPDLAAMVLESPYPTFNDWYEGRGWSLDRVAIAAWSFAFRKSMPAVDARIKFPRSRTPAMVAWSANDETTPPALSAAVAALRPDASTYVGRAAHLGLWHELAYRQAVMDLLCSPRASSNARPHAVVEA